MKIYISTTKYGIFVDLDKTSLTEYLICLEQQYPEVSYFNKEKKK